MVIVPTPEDDAPTAPVDDASSEAEPSEPSDIEALWADVHAAVARSDAGMTTLRREVGAVFIGAALALLRAGWSLIRPTL